MSWADHEGMKEVAYKLYLSCDWEHVEAVGDAIHYAAQQKTIHGEVKAYLLRLSDAIDRRIEAEQALDEFRKCL